MDPTQNASLERAREIVRRAHGISPSPSLLRLEAHLRAGDTSARQLAQLIEGSPALAARVLRMANSAFYSPREPVISLTRAVAILGDTVLRQLVLTSLIVSRQAGGRSPRQALAIARLMGDAVRSAVVSRSLADLSGLALPDEAFSAGLLHDLGHVYLLDEIGEFYAAYLLDPSWLDADLEREIELSGTTHTDVGAVFAYEWNLPRQVGKVLHEHHTAEDQSLPAMVQAADWLVRELTKPSASEQARISAEVEACLESLGLTRERWAERVDTARSQYADLLTLFDAIAA
jgi:HD-like signal output (HDOD) protein